MMTSVAASTVPSVGGGDASKDAFYLGGDAPLLLRPNLHQILYALGVLAGSRRHAMPFAEETVFTPYGVLSLLLCDYLGLGSRVKNDIKPERHAQNGKGPHQGVAPLVRLKQHTVYRAHGVSLMLRRKICGAARGEGGGAHSCRGKPAIWFRPVRAGPCRLRARPEICRSNPKTSEIRLPTARRPKRNLPVNMLADPRGSLCFSRFWLYADTLARFRRRSPPPFGGGGAHYSDERIAGFGI